MVARAPLSIIDRDSITVDNTVVNPIPVAIVSGGGGGGGGGTQDVNVVNTVGLTDAQLRAAPVNVNTGLLQGTTPADTQPISAVNLPLPIGASTAAKQLPDNHQVTVSNFPAQTGLTDAQLRATPVPITGSVIQVAQLIPAVYDQIDLVYTGANVTTVTYKQATVTVATLTLSYTGDNLTSVVRT